MFADTRSKEALSGFGPGPTYPLLSAHPIDAPEARRLADEYNKDLRRKLNLSAAVAPAPGGGQVAVAGRF